MDRSCKERIAKLEHEIAELRTKVNALHVTVPWWERIAGTFKKDPIYKNAMQLGREYRESQRPRSKGGEGK